MMDRSIVSTTRGRQRGFTLVELMVAVALGMLVMVALVSVYLNVSRTNSEMYKTNGMIENGRFAIDVLNEDLSHAGYWAGFIPQFDNFSLRTVPGDVPDAASLALGPCNAYSAWTAAYKTTLVGLPVEVYGDGTPTGCGTLFTDRKPGTDVLVVRHADTCQPGSANCEAFDAGKVYFQASHCAIETDAGVYYDLGKRAALADFPLKLRGCTGGPPPTATVGTQADVRKFVSNIYYIRTWASTAGDGVPTLVRSSFGVSGGVPAFEAPQALIEGIEAFRVELGVDDRQSRCAAFASPSVYIPASADYTRAIQTGAPATLVNPSTCTPSAATPASNTLPSVRGDGVPDSYVHCGSGGCTAAQLMSAVSAKVYLVSRSKDATPGYTDSRTYTLGAAGAASFSGADAGYKRHLFQSAVRLTNVSGRRETPLP